MDIENKQLGPVDYIAHEHAMMSHAGFVMSSTILVAPSCKTRISRLFVAPAEKKPRRAIHGRQVGTTLFLPHSEPCKMAGSIS